MGIVSALLVGLLVGEGTCLEKLGVWLSTGEDFRTRSHFGQFKGSVRLESAMLGNSPWGNKYSCEQTVE